MHIKKLIIVLFCFLAAGYGAYTWLRHQIAPTVWTVPVDVKSSPTARWRAWVEETVVEDEPMSSIVDEVRLLDLHDYEKIMDVLAVDTRGHADEQPRIAWTAPNVLQVTVPNLSYVTVQRRAYEDVRIDLKFDPDDPAARAAWLKRLNERDAGVGQVSTMRDSRQPRLPMLPYSAASGCRRTVAETSL